MDGLSIDSYISRVEDFMRIAPLPNEGYIVDNCWNGEFTTGPVVKHLEPLFSILINGSDVAKQNSAHRYHILMQCVSFSVESGVLPSCADVRKFASTNLFPAKTDECQQYLKTLDLLLTSHRTKGNKCDCIIECHLDVFKDLFTVSKDICYLAGEVVSKAYLSLDACLKSNSLINAFLFISCNPRQYDTFEYIFNLTVPANWLKRSILHLVAIFVHDEHILKHIPLNIIEHNINSRDLHGCMPLHIAYLHQNYQAVQFLKCHGADEDGTDSFGFKPMALRFRADAVNVEGEFQTVHHCTEHSPDVNTEHSPDVLHLKMCREVMQANSGILDKICPMLLFTEEADILSKEMKQMFECVIKHTKFGENVTDVVIAGSMREKLKVGRLDEVDVQIRFKRESDEVDIGQIVRDIPEGLGRVNLNDTHLRPVDISNPWGFMWERPGGSQGVKVSVDLVLVYETGTPDEKTYARQALILQNPQMHDFMEFHPIKEYYDRGFRPTYFAPEWDVLDSLPMGWRMGILFVKALLEAYYWSNGMHLLNHKKPIKSYLVKSAVFRILEDGENLVVSEGQESDRQDGATDSSSTENGKQELLTYKPSPKWVDEEDIRSFAEEGRILAQKIFETISQNPQPQKNFWTNAMTWPTKITIDPLREVCECLTRLLDKNKFY